MQPQMPGKLSQRILTLEQQADRVAAVIDQLAVRESGTQARQHVRTAVTVDGGSGYPGSGYSFEIKFVDPSFSGETGATSATFTNRQATAQAVVYNIGESYIEEGTEIEVWNQNGYWWTDWWCC